MRADRLPGESPGYRGRHIRRAVPAEHRAPPSPRRRLWAHRARPVPYFLAACSVAFLAYSVVVGFHASSGEVRPYIPPPADPPAVACTDCTEDPAWAELGDDWAPVDDRTVPERPSRNRAPTSGPENMPAGIPAPGRPASATSTSSPPGVPLMATPTACPPPLPIAPPATAPPKGKGKPSRSPKKNLTGPLSPTPSA